MNFSPMSFNLVNFISMSFSPVNFTSGKFVDLMMSRLNVLYLFVLAALLCSPVNADTKAHPHLVLNKQDVKIMRKTIRSTPLFDDEYKAIKARVDSALANGIVVPVPKDAGGGYTHEQHKRNYQSIYNAGLVYLLSGKSEYMEFSRDLLLAYAQMYPSLGEHPQKKEQSPGRLFWQSLNESVWLVHSIQGYDAIYASLTQKERAKIEQGVLRPMAKFLSVESPQTFNKVHNHGTWAVAAVGMTGYVLGEKSWVKKALLGLEEDGKAGFLKQLDALFSPQGYYTEGPYYQRYALMPFMVFAKAIDYNEPERKIFSYREGILEKALYATIQLSYANYFFPINDALKDKGLDTAELITGVAIMYGINSDPSLLSIAREQGSISLSSGGAKIAQGLAKGKALAFPFKSQQFGDGAKGEQGTLDVLRHGGLTVVAKNTSQGMGHGHFDKLNWLLYDNDNEIISDYGAARFLNVESKYGGHYLPENKTWAKQTIAHNTLVVDERSHFNGKLKLASKHHPEPLAFHVAKGHQISAAKMVGAYEGVDFTRTWLMVEPQQEGEHPLIIDVLRAESESDHQYDLPLYYQGHIVNSNLVHKAPSALEVFGKDNGYQHLWLRARASFDKSVSKNEEKNAAQITWLKDTRFYTLSTPVLDTDVFFLELGANDPNFNLRKESAILQRVNNKKNHTFVSVIEPHGEYNGAAEYTVGNYSAIADVTHERKGEYDIVWITKKDGERLGLALASDANANRKHSVNSSQGPIAWQGYYSFLRNK